MLTPNIPEKSRKIALFIGGAQKAGTTSLKEYLGEHPDVITHSQKEFAYFYDDADFRKGQESAFKKYFHQHHPERKLIAKNAGLYVKEEGIRRLHDHNPECEFVLILRNPVERTYSAYQMERNYGHIRDPFEIMGEVIRIKDKSDWRYDFFIRMSLYVQHLKTIYRYFPKEQVSIFRFEDLGTAPDKICSELFRKIGVRDDFQPDFSVKHNVTHHSRSVKYGRIVMKLLNNTNPLKRIASSVIPAGQDYKIGEMLRNVNRSKKKPEKISGEIFNQLTAFYAPFNEELEQLSGMDFSSWNYASQTP